jgi:hypothetical protein
LRLRTAILGIALGAVGLRVISRLALALKRFTESEREEGRAIEELHWRIDMLEAHRKRLARESSASPQNERLLTMLKEQVEWDGRSADYIRRCVAFHSRAKWDYLRAAVVFWNPLPEQQLPPEDSLTPWPLRLY